MKLSAKTVVVLGFALGQLGSGIAFAADGAVSEYRIPEQLFSGEARGPHRTGTFEELWVDPQRDDPTTSSPLDRRHLMVQVWYPATFKGDPQRAVYALNAELYPRDARSPLPDRAKSVRTTSVLNAPLIATPHRLPVLIYNPGAGYPPYSATFQTEFLASHGYVVVSVGHTDVTGIRRFPDGYVYRRDRNMPGIDNERRRSMTASEQLGSWIKQISGWQTSLHVEDISFVLDRLQSMATTRGSFFYQRLDFDRVGALGWSLGGAASIQASRDDPRIKAAANFDGRLYTDAANTGTRRPLLQMHAERRRTDTPTPAERETQLLGDSLFWRLYSQSAADWYDLTLNGASHRHFSDATLMEPLEPGYMHPRLAHDITNAFTLEFFDKYLRGRVVTPLLSGSMRFADTELMRSDAP
jgi:predicted dienelactone hydrolase